MVSLGPRPLFEKEPQQKRTLGGPPHLVWVHSKTEKPLGTIRERNQEPSLIKPVAQPIHDLQFAILSTSALQNTTPYPVILLYQRWKQQGHSKRIFQSVGYFKDLQTTRKDVCSWHWGAAVKCCSLKLVRRNFINLAYVCSLPALLVHVFVGYIKQKVKTPWEDKSSRTVPKRHNHLVVNRNKGVVLFAIYTSKINK